MRINVYSQELTDEFELTEKRSNTGVVYHAVRLFLHSSPMLHHPPKDDDRSAITIWLPGSDTRRRVLADTFRLMARAIESAPSWEEI